MGNIFSRIFCFGKKSKTNKAKDWEFREKYSRALGLRHLGRDKEAFSLILELGEKGYTQVFHSLGYLYESGIGTERDLNKAEEWYKKASQTDNS